MIRYFDDEPPAGGGQPPSHIPEDTNIEEQIEEQVVARVEAIQEQQAQQQVISTNGRVYTRFIPADDIVENDKQIVTTGIWSGDAGTLTTFFTSSAQSGSSGRYYYDVYDKAASDSTRAAQFSVAYGHRLGSGSEYLSSTEVGYTPSKAIYSQYRNLLLTAGDQTFTFEGSVDSEDIYIINIVRERLKEKLDPGNWQLNLSGSSAVGTLKLIDDSESSVVDTVTDAGRVYNIVSGTIDDGIHTAASTLPYGLCYPDLGFLILNPTALDASASFNTNRSVDVEGNNAFKLFSAISGSGYFAARRSEDISSTHYFVRVKNGEYNYSNNITFTTGSDGDLRHADMIHDPKSYVTTVGLYNDKYELLAIAKLSQPLLKSFSREALVRVKLDF